MPKLNPAGQFPDSQAAIHEILKRWGIDVHNYDRAKSGIENSTFIIYSTIAKYVLRIYRQGKKSDIEITQEIDFMQTLSTDGIPIPQIIHTTDNTLLAIVEYDNKRWQCLVMSYAPGWHPQQYSPQLLDSMAQIQARMHIQGEKYATARALTPNIMVLQESHFSKDLLFRHSHDWEFAQFIQQVQSFSLELDSALPSGLSHYDYDKDNLFTRLLSKLGLWFNVVCLDLRALRV